MGGEEAKGGHCGDLVGRKQGGDGATCWPRGERLRSRWRACCTNDCLRYWVGELAKHGVRQAFFSVICELFCFITRGLCLSVLVRIKTIAKRKNTLCPSSA